MTTTRDPFADAPSCPGYTARARAILTAIAALAPEYPVLEGLDPAAAQRIDTPKMFIRFDFARGLRTEPNPYFDANNPYTAASRMRSVPGPDGVRLTMLFYEGRWPGLDRTRTSIAGMDVVVHVSAGDVAMRERLVGAINAILAAHDPNAT